jgi:hypothetical protein
MTYPGDENEFDKKATPMKNPITTDKGWRGVGAKTKVRAEKVSIKDSKTGKVYGTRTIMQKNTSEQLTFSAFLISEGAADITVYPEIVIKELRKLIREGANDLEQQWKNALELVNTAFKVANIRIPLPDQKGAWKQYEELIQYGVKQLHDARGIDGPWRLTNSSLREGEDPFDIYGSSDKKPASLADIESDQTEMGDIGKRRIFAEIPGAGQVEVHVKDFDELLTTMENQLRSKGARLRVDQRSDKNMMLSVLVRNGEEWVKREEIRVRDFS